MPVIFLNTIEGQSLEQRKKMAKKITVEAARDLNVPEKNVQIIITERPAENMYIGGEPLAENELNPIAFINTKTGKSPDLLKTFKKDVAQAIADTCDIPVEKVVVYFIEHSH